MSTFVIAKKDTEDLETIVFTGDDGDAVAVFTDSKSAEQYIADADWQEEFTVAELEPIDFMEWLIQCHRSGIEHMATNPVRAEHEEGRSIDTLDIEAHLNHAARHIESIANPDF